MRSVRIASVVCGLSLLATALVPAAQARGQLLPLEVRLARALRAQGISPAATAALVVDLDSRAIVFQQNPELALAPASAEKLTVALTALDELGPGYRFRTLVLGRGTRSGSTWHGDLVLKGFGDPTLRAPDIGRLAAAIAAQGIERVTGAIVGDESYYDGKRTAPGWKPSFYKVESPPLSALVVDRAWREGRTSDYPALQAARLFRMALARQGVNVGKRVLVRKVAEPRTTVLAKDDSVTLAQLVATMNTESDNFVAEMLLKQLGAVASGRGATVAGTRVVRKALREHGVRLSGVQIFDGSGLSYDDRLTPNALVDLLLAGRSDATIASSFVDSLAVAGRTGTLEDRLEGGPADGVVRAKTGTTAIASALAGFVGERYAFAILMNDDELDYWAARRAQDRFVTLLARRL